ncbi:MFS-type transporter SLC18B1 [Portunus trituberculatus]|uniref:MFS-type transporter SLC18B1 n=1 Tax=Portunus trituberculatus TaxID=210409 RepID=A0A5B7JXX7_PORTR|nr:MFS-type transporter SLC18B1 [Portunus trituberculatus]
MSSVSSQQRSSRFQFGLRESYVGLLFGLKDGTNSLASPFWGWLCDRHRNNTKHFIFISSILAFTSFFILGPFPGLPFERTVGTVILSLSLNGVGIGGQQVAGVVDAMREAVTAGLPDQAGLHGCVAGLWTSLSGIGRFTSRTGSGYLVDTIGFRNTSAVVVALHAFVVSDHHHDARTTAQ